MQIGPNKLLRFLPGSTQPLAAQAGDKDTTDAAAASTAAAPATAPAQEDAGVILAIRSEAPGAAAVPADLVYSNNRKSVAATDDVTDVERMAAQHQQALERSTGSSSLSVDKDGVLVAQAASPASHKAQDFVSVAVSAMREYADEQERLKTARQAADAANDADTSVLPRSLVEVQKLAARFKLFT